MPAGSLLMNLHMLLLDIPQFLRFQTSGPQYLDLQCKAPGNHCCKIDITL